ncbi:hypothetical protein HELRODRAFT_194396 [Helobdella robusta]|uniref:WD repeat-containing protein 91 n=1 Tax=Helobdella robusta TaxID=6412 RepID=T1FW05_HELRO|nr:hypothetical protein HELRODRAFT_194396 [Helobdella robusta]ESN92134.1 hypothetical protein HELRODRAFT_194396 [Helobdella robusta]
MYGSGPVNCAQWGLPEDEVTSMKHYFLFRGLSATSKTFENEIKQDTTAKSFRADKIADQLLSYCTNFNILSLKDFWSFLEQTIFSELEGDQQEVANRLYNRLLKLYIVYACRASRSDKVFEFFDKMSTHITNNNNSEWTDWPALLNYNNDFYRMSSLELENATLKLRLENLLKNKPQVQQIRQQQQQCANNIDADFNVLDDFYDLNRPQQLMLADGTLMTTSTAAPTTRNSLSTLIRNFTSPSINSASSDRKVEKKSTASTFGASAAATVASFTSTMTSSPAATATTTAKLAMASVSSFSSFFTASSSLMGPQTPATASIIENHTKTSTTTVTASAAATATAINTTQKPQQHLTTTPGNNLTWSAFDCMPTSSSPSYASHCVGSLKTDTPVATTTMMTSLKTTTTTTNYDVNKPPSLSCCYEEDEDDIVDAGGDINEIAKINYKVVRRDDFTEHTAPIVSCRLSYGGKSVASLDAEGVMKIWTNQPTIQTRASTMSKSILTSLEWLSTSGRYLLLGSRVGSIRIFDSRDRLVIRELNVDSNYPKTVCISSSPHGTTFVTSSSGRLISSSSSSSFTLPSQHQPQQPLKQLKTGKLTVWDLKDDVKQDRALPISPGPVMISCMTHSLGGSLLLCGGVDGFVRVYDMRVYNCVLQWQTTNHDVTGVSFAGNDNACYVTDSLGLFSKWSLSNISMKIFEQSVDKFNSLNGRKSNSYNCWRSFVLNESSSHALICHGPNAAVYMINENGLKEELPLSDQVDDIVCVDWSETRSTNNLITATSKGNIQIYQLKMI